MNLTRRQPATPDGSTAPCTDCGASVPVDAATCAACGYGVAGHDRWRLFLGALGTALTLSVVLAPVGLPLLWAADRHRRRAGGSVTAPELTSMSAHLATVLRHHLSVSTPAVPRGEFTRGGATAGFALDRPPEL